MQYRSTSCFFILALFLQFSLFSVTAQSQESSSSIIINEFLASNSNTISDENNDFSDWIELYNPTANAVNISGWGLSDDESSPFKWEFPNVTIEPGQFLIVWASGKDRRPNQGEMVNGIKQEVFLDLSGTSIDDLLNSSNYPQNPSYTEIITGLFEAPIDVNDYYGQRMYGQLKAPATGNYTFWISGDDNCNLYLSSNEQAVNAILIAEVPDWTISREWNKYDTQQSSSVYLTEGDYYYISALMKEDSGGDNLAVGWQLPDGTIEQPLSATHIFLPDGELHTNFSLSAGGESLILTNSSGETVQSIAPVELTSDISYGIIDGQEGFYFFNTPTPGSANTTPGFNEILQNTLTFSQTSGFYNDGFDLSIACDDPDVSIYYTVDGSEPNPDNLNGTSYEYKNSYPSGSMLTRTITTMKYSEPITIHDRSEDDYELAAINTRYNSSVWLPINNFFKGTVIRAKAVKEKAISPYSVTHTYFITPLDDSRYDLPVISISTDEPNLFEYNTGIYTAGLYADEWVANNPSEEWNDGRQANYNQRGIDWEKAASFEYFPQNGDPVYDHSIGIRVHGGWSRAFYRKSLRLYARNAYGAGNTFNYPFFGDLPARGNLDYLVTDFRRLIIRNSGNDFDATLYRDALMQKLIEHLPMTTMACRPAVHFINGEYWGIINLRERYDQYYLESHYGVDPDNVAILDAWGNVDTGISEDRIQFNEIINYAETNSPALNTPYQWLLERIDVENLIQYYAAQIYFYNTDWPQNNMTFWRDRTGIYSSSATPGHDGRWRWMLYDTDFGMNLYGSNQYSNGLSRVMDASANDPSSRLLRRLLLNTTFKNRFLNVVADQLNSCFQPDYIEQKVNEFNALLASSRNEHYNRWRSGTDEGSSIKTFGNQRPGYVISQTVSQFGLSGTVNLTLGKSGDGGSIMVNSIGIDANLPGIPNPDTPFPWIGTYFRNIPITLKAIDTPGYRFSNWIGIVSEDKYNREIEALLTQNTAITAVFNKATFDMIHYWHFNDLPDDNLTSVKADYTLTETPGLISYPGYGDGYMDRVSEGSEINIQQDAVSGSALRVRNPSDTRHLELSLPTTGYESIEMKYAVTRTSKGSDLESVYYRTSDDGEWILFRENIPLTEAYQLITLDFSDILAVNNNSQFAVKITFPGEAASGSSGNNRLDNIAVQGYDDITLVPESEIKTAINIYPNPTSDVVHIITDMPIKTIKMFDLNGRCLKYEKADDYSHDINVTDLPKGIYILEVITDNDIVHRKIVVN